MNRDLYVRRPAYSLARRVAVRPIIRLDQNQMPGIWPQSRDNNDDNDIYDYPEGRLRSQSTRFIIKHTASSYARLAVK